MAIDFRVVKKSMPFGKHTLHLETGRVARQAHGAVVCSLGDTVVLATTVLAPPKQADFLPLSVHVQTRTYAAGRVPGSYFRREGKPTEEEVLASRLVDRPLRPLFPQGFYHETQVVVTVLSHDPEIDVEIPSMIAASASVVLSGAPCEGVMAAARVGYCDGAFVLNPSHTGLEGSKLNLVVAGTDTAVLMVESEAHELSEDTMLEAIVFGHNHFKPVISLIRDLVDEAGVRPFEWQPPEPHQELSDLVRQRFGSEFASLYQTSSKTERSSGLSALRKKILAELCEGDTPQFQVSEVRSVCAALEESIVRDRILSEGSRIDGRDLKTVRPLDMQIDVLPRTHGSALFTRGETQALVVTTLGTTRDAQMMEVLRGDLRERFMLHYNFPPYSVGEVGMVGAPKRREIGHGRLARRALEAIMPSEKDFPYVLRVVSEITESNGSSSMATVCGASLSLMAAGVPIKAPVAGIAMGLILEDSRYAVLTDILGDEDHLGDMDFKVAGTQSGVTALQMDIKVAGITPEIMKVALAQAKDARMHILECMNTLIDASRTDISMHAPRLISIKIPVEKIRDVIGKGGSVIRALSEETGAVIDITDEGVVTIASSNAEKAELARSRVESITMELEVGQIYDGKVVRLMDFGAIVSVAPGKDGLVHISQISKQRVERIEDFLKEGQEVRVRVLEIDRQGRVRLSMKEFEGEQ